MALVRTLLSFLAILAPGLFRPWEFAPEATRPSKTVAHTVSQFEPAGGEHRVLPSQRWQVADAEEASPAPLCPCHSFLHLNLLSICEIGRPIPAPQFIDEEKGGSEGLMTILPQELPDSLGGQDL